MCEGLGRAAVNGISLGFPLKNHPFCCKNNALNVVLLRIKKYS